MIHYVVKVPRDPSSFPNWTALEKRALEFFRSRTSTELAGCMISELWSSFILQAAYHSSAIKHAVIGLGALHEGFQRWDPTRSNSFAVQQYSKAIRDVSNLRPSKPNEALDVALLCCMLFAAFESLRGYYKSALTHIGSGMKLVTARQNCHEYEKQRSHSWRLIRPIFVCLDTQAMEVCDDLLCSSDMAFEKLDALILPNTFTSIEEASNSFTIYRNHVLRFFQKYESLLNPEIIAEEAPKVRTEHVNFARYFQHWCTVFNEANFPEHHPQVLIIQMYMTVVKMIATLVPSPDETKWDASSKYFDLVVTLGEEFMHQRGSSQRITPLALDSTSWSVNQSDLRDSKRDRTGSNCSSCDRSTDSNYHPNSTSSDTSITTSSFWNSELPELEAPNEQNFTLAHGIITPLYMVCTRCRDPSIRRRALRILQTCNRKEGIWDSTQSALVAKRVIQIEETAAGGFISEASQIPSHARIQELETTFGPGKPGKIMYTMNGATIPVTIVEHLHSETGQANFEGREENMKSRSFFSTRFTVLPRPTMLS
jgi:hypothetical protein